MKANELFIGALCLYDTHDGWELYEMSGKGIYLLEIEPNAYEKRHKPIPLTPEVVGCIEGITKSYGGWDIYNEANICISCDLRGSVYIVVGDFDESGSTNLPHITALHQLQALYMALTGQEMKVDIDRLKNVIQDNDTTK